MVAAAIVGTGLATAAVGAISANSAANTQAGSVNNANAIQQGEYNQTRADQAPYRTAGYSALSKMSDLLGLSGNTTADGYGSLTTPFTGSSVASDPGYQFGLTQGLKAQSDSAAARGGLYSGAQLKAASQYGTDYATTKFDDAFNRDQTTKTALYNKLAGVSGTGQAATTQVDNAGATTAATQGSNLIGAGNARGAADIATGNAISGAANSGTAWWLRSYTPPPPVTNGSDPYGYNGTQNNPSAYVGGP